MRAITRRATGTLLVLMLALFTTRATVAGGDAYGVLVLSPDSKMKLSGSASILSTMLRVNSADAAAITASGSAVLDVPDVFVAGGVKLWGPEAATGTLRLGATPAPDPLASLAPPAWDPSDDLGARSFGGGAYDVEPGYYSGGISISGGQVTFRPGTYVLDGDGLVVSGGGRVQGRGVLLFIKGSGRLVFSGGSTADLQPLASGTYREMTIFMDRSNDSRVTLSGGSGFRIGGTLYCPANKVTISADSSVESETPLAGNLLIAHQLEISGSGRIAIGRSPSLPTPDMMFD